MEYHVLSYGFQKLELWQGVWGYILLLPGRFLGGFGSVVACFRSGLGFCIAVVAVGLCTSLLTCPYRCGRPLGLGRFVMCDSVDCIVERYSDVYNSELRMNIEIALVLASRKKRFTLKECPPLMTNGSMISVLTGPDGFEVSFARDAFGLGRHSIRVCGPSDRVDAFANYCGFKYE